MGLNGPISRKSFVKSRNNNIFEELKLNRNLQRIPFIMMYNMSMLRHRLSNERGGRGGGGEGRGCTSLSYSVKCVLSIITDQSIVLQDYKKPARF